MAHHAGQRAGSHPARDLLGIREIAILAACAGRQWPQGGHPATFRCQERGQRDSCRRTNNQLLQLAVDEELAHHAEAVVERVGNDAWCGSRQCGQRSPWATGLEARASTSVDDGRVEREGHAVLLGILPVVSRLQEPHICAPAEIACRHGGVASRTRCWLGAHRQCRRSSPRRSSPATAHGF